MFHINSSIVTISVKCPHPLDTIVNICHNGYTMFEQDEGAYSYGWVPANASGR